MTANLCVPSLSLWIRRLSILWVTVVTIWMGGMPITAGAEPPSSGTIDIMFAIDNSGSMRKNDPEFITPKVVNAFISGIPLEARVGMVIFDQTARLIKPLTSVTTEEARAEFVSSLSRIDYKGKYTDSAAGIERALYELKINGRPDALKGIVFITDGILDTGDAKKDQVLNQWLKQDLTAESRQLGVHIFGIAFSEAADFALIQALATRTGGGYYRTYEASNISKVLDDILTLLSPQIPESRPTPATPEDAAATASPALSVPATADRIAPQPPQAETGSIQFTLVILVLMIILLVSVVILFYINSMGSSKKRLPIIRGAAITPPDAYLEDLAQAAGSGAPAPALEIKKERITVGRDRRNDFIIERPTISSFHATIEYRDMVFFLEDQRSTNGTRLNDKKLESNMPVRLKNGDRISFASFQYKFVIPNQIPFNETAMMSMTAMPGEEPGSTVVLDLEDAQCSHELVACVQNHLLQLHAMGPKYREFITNYFAYDMLEVVAAKAHDNLLKTESDGKLHCDSLQQRNAFYLVCSLPVPISAAADWYGVHYNGFTQFLMKWIKSEEYKSCRSDMLCVVTFGQDPATWVSLTILPTCEQGDPVEIMSVDFLNEAEKAMLALDFDHHGQVA